MFHKVKSVAPLSDFKLSVQFSEGVTKLYDVKPLFEKISAFRYLKDNPSEFDCVSVDVGGYGIVWNDDLVTWATSLTVLCTRNFLNRFLSAFKTEDIILILINGTVYSKTIILQPMF